MKSTFWLNSFCVLLLSLIGFFAAEKIYDQFDVPFTAESSDFGCQHQFSSLVGGEFAPDCSSRWKKISNSQTLFDVQFSTDHWGRRLSPAPPEVSLNTSPILFFGGSDVLGKAVNDDETLTSQYLKISHSAEGHNFGGIGFGPQQMLELFEKSDVKSEVKGTLNQTKLVFFFSDAQIERAAGSWNVAAYWGYEFPYYALDNNGRLVNKGRFGDGNRFWPVLYNIKKTHLLQDLILNLSYQFDNSDDDIRLTAKIFEEAKNRFYSQFGSERFYIVFSSYTSKEIAGKLSVYLNAMNIKYLDYSKLLDIYSPKYKMPEGHPSAEAYKIYSQHLAKDLPL